MARTHATRRDEGTKQRDLGDQPTPFLGLFLAPLAALALSWVLHYVIMGVNVGPIHITGSLSYLTLAIMIITLGAGAVAYQAWQLSADRRPAIRNGITASAGIIGLWVALLVGVGPHRWWGTFFVLCAWGVSAIWAIPRLHALRADPREAEPATDGEEDFLKEIGLKGYKFKQVEVRTDPKTGEPTRAVYDVKHRFGQTRENLGRALPNLESAVGAPEHLSRAVKPADGKSNHTTVTLILQDPLVGRVPYNGPSRPGGSVADPAVVGMYDDGEPVLVWACGGFIPDLDERGRPIIEKGKPVGTKLSPTGYAFMGMTRAGKTVTENRWLLDAIITRRGGCILYLNQAKGEQDVASIIDGVEVAVLAPDDKAKTTAVYRVSTGKVVDIIGYRQKELARFGISAWSAATCFDNPPPGMEPMPVLVAHMGEADVSLDDHQVADNCQFIASKGLSTGVVPGFALQRWDHQSMPTSLRYNLGLRFCFGIGDEVSAGFALSDPTIAAGAHPENWRATKPGRFFVEGNGIDDTRWPVSAKGIGDEDDDALYANMRRDAAQYGPLMSKLDRGSALATRGWWDEQVRETNTLRARLLGSIARATGQAPPDPAPAPDPVPAPPVQAYDPPASTTGEPDQHMTEEEYDHAAAQQDADQVEEVDGVPVFGGLIPDDPDDPGSTKLRKIDPGHELPPPTDADDFEIPDPKPEPPDNATAEQQFEVAAAAMMADREYRDPDDPDGRSVLFRIGQMAEAFPFRSRPWFSGHVATLAETGQVMSNGLRLTSASDLGRPGWYRMWHIDRPPTHITP